MHTSLSYKIGDSGQRVTFSSDAMEHFLRHQQTWRWRREAGGQLFARVSNDLIAIEKATGPRPTDLRTRLTYVPDRRAEQLEINAHHAQGLHFVGDWHTHRQRQPVPSPRDIQSIVECLRRSTHDLRGFVLVIVGTLPPPDGFHVSVHDGYHSCMLVAEPCTPGTSNET